MGLLRRGQQAALWSRRHDAAYEGRSVRWKKDNVYGFLFVHLIAGLSFFPWFFSWTGVALLGVGIFVFGLLGIKSAQCAVEHITVKDISGSILSRRGLPRGR
jgi:hypothetical protein